MRITLYGPDGQELELYRGIGFLRSQTVRIEPAEDCVGHTLVEGAPEDWSEQCLSQHMARRASRSSK
jgi:hypothetical protein